MSKLICKITPHTHTTACEDDDGGYGCGKTPHEHSTGNGCYSSAPSTPKPTGSNPPWERYRSSRRK